jgi:hypothetical protein
MWLKTLLSIGAERPNQMIGCNDLQAPSRRLISKCGSKALIHGLPFTTCLGAADNGLISANEQTGQIAVGLRRTVSAFGNAQGFVRVGTHVRHQAAAGKVGWFRLGEW